MYIYRISHAYDDHAFQGYTAAIVVAESVDDARLIRPSFTLKDGEFFPCRDDEWCSPRDVRVELLGIADPSLTAGQIIMTRWVARDGQWG